MSTRQQARRRDDQGGTELFVLVTLMMMLIALGLVVDGGAYLRAKDQASWCAQQAARAAGQRIDLGLAATGQAPVVVGSSAAATAQQAVAAAGMVGTTTLNGDGSVTVTCTAEYRPIVLAVAGAAPWHDTEQATARPVRGVSGEE